MDVDDKIYVQHRRDMEEKKKRCQKTTRQQYMIYLEELQSNEYFRWNKFSPENPDILQNTWEKLTLSLNSAGGPQKSTAAWKKIFSDWKSAVKKRARVIKAARTETGGGSPEKPLNDIEEKLIDILGRVAIDGLQDVPEAGGTVTNEVVTNTPEIISEVAQPEPLRYTQPEINKPQPSSSAGDNLGSNQNGTKRSYPFSITPSKRRTNNTLLSSLKGIVNENTSHDNNMFNILKDIDNKLNKLVNLKRKKYELDVLKLQLKYPNVDFVENVNSVDDE